MAFQSADKGTGEDYTLIYIERVRLHETLHILECVVC